MAEIKSQRRDSKRGLPELTSQECQQQLKEAFAANLDEKKVTQIISRLGEPNLNLTASIPLEFRDDKQKRNSALAIIVESLKTNTSCKNLSGRYFHFDDDDASVLAELLMYNQSIVSLDLEYNNIGDTGAQALAKMLETNETLKALNLRNNQINIVGLKSIFEIIVSSKNSSLKKFYVNNSDISFDPIIDKKLETIRIKTPLWNPEDVKEPLSPLTEENCQWELIQAFNRPEAPNQQDITCIVSRLNDPRLNLEKCLSDNLNKRRSSIEAIAQALRNNKVCTTLNASEYPQSMLDDWDVVHLAEMLKFNTSIETLNLSRTNISDEGIPALVEMLKTNTTLKKIDLRYSKITVVGAKKLAEVILSLQNSTLTSCSITNRTYFRKNSSAAQSLAYYQSLITDHLDYYIRTGQMARHASTANEEVIRILPADLSAIVLTYLGFDKFVAAPTPNSDSKPTKDPSLIKDRKEQVLNFFIGTVTFIMFSNSILAMISESHPKNIGEFLYAGSLNSSCPNLITIDLGIVGFGLFASLAFFYWKVKKKENYTIPEIEQRSPEENFVDNVNMLL